MSSPSRRTVDPDADRILSYWFQGKEPLKRWFMGGAKVDEEIKTRFSTLVEKARGGQLQPWADQPQEALALVILLDQFPRNLFRGSALSYSSDHLARDVATQAIARGFNRQVEWVQQMFFYLPFAHHENLLSQIACFSFYETMVATAQGDEQKHIAQSALQSSRAHLEPILKFGRFPSRNECLGRTSTSEETDYLVENPGFSGSN